MALNAAVVLRVRPGGHDTNNGGGFRPGVGGTDRSQQDAAHVSLTVAATVHTTTTMINVPSGQHTVSAADVGNLYQINGGTATAGIYEITAADVGNNRWTLDRSAGTSAQTAPGGMGGALASPGRAAQVKVVGNTVYTYSGTYDLSSSSNVAGGRVSDTSTGTFATPNRWYGEGPTRPVLRSGASTITLFTGGAYCHVQGLEFRRNTGAGHTQIKGLQLQGDHGWARDCRAYDCDTDGFLAITGSGIRFENSFASGCRSGFANSTSHARFIRCVATACTTSGFSLGNYDVLVGCLAHANTSDGFRVQNAGGLLLGCVSYANTGSNIHGFYLSGTGTLGGNWLVNCLAVNNGTSGTAHGFGSGTNTSTTDRLINCAAYGNLTADYNPSFPAVTLEGFLSLSANPFVSAAGLDFSLNNTAGGGALLRAAGYPASWPEVSTDSYPDVGLAQSESGSAGGGGINRYAACGRAF